MNLIKKRKKVMNKILYEKIWVLLQNYFSPMTFGDKFKELKEKSK
jgi:hypothetical protein